MMGALVFLLGVLAGGAAAQVQSAEPRSRRAQSATERNVPAPRASIFFCETADVQCRTELNQFRLDELRDLVMFVAWQRVTGEHTQQVRFILPDGNVYQVMETKFTTLARGARPGVQGALPSRGERAVSTVLPVAGTHIAQRTLSGTWTVEVLLDGELITTASFVLRGRE
jgi:hypothetical protein